MSLKASINAYKKIAEKKELTAEELRQVIYEFRDNVDKLEAQLNELKKDSE